jgi:hypothetical protein
LKSCAAEGAGRRGELAFSSASQPGDSADDQELVDMPTSDANSTVPAGQTKLDRRMEALLGDNLPKHLGSGWFAGVFGVLLGAGSLLTVMVFRYPQWLTASETAPRYPVESMRMILALAIIASFLLSALNILLRPSKRLGLTGLFFCMAAVLAGGSTVEVGGGPAAFRVGLDWFVLNVVLLAIVFVPLERLFPLNAEQGTFRPGWTTDGIYFLVSHVLVELLTFFTLLPATLIARSFHAQVSGFDPTTLPLAVEVFAIMVVADLAQYAIHRTFHVVGWLWPFHAIHHSSRLAGWFSPARRRYRGDANPRAGAAFRLRLFTVGALHLVGDSRGPGDPQPCQHPLRHSGGEPVPCSAALPPLAPRNAADRQELCSSLSLDRSVVWDVPHASR